MTIPTPTKTKKRGIVDNGPDIPKTAFFYAIAVLASIGGLAIVLLLEVYWPAAGGGWFYSEGHPAGIFSALSVFFLLTAVISMVTLCITWSKRGMVRYAAIIIATFLATLPVSEATIPVRDDPIPSFNYWFVDNYYDIADPEGVYKEITETNAETVMVQAEKKEDKSYTFDIIWDEDHTGFRLKRVVE